MEFFFLLFDGFESLDLFGPVEIFGRTPDPSLRYISMEGGPAVSAQGAAVLTEKADRLPAGSALLVPGGRGTRRLVTDGVFLEKLGALADGAEWVLSVCTGSALLAAAGRLCGVRATSNKLAFDWAMSAGGADWVRNARWVRDGRFYTSSGVSAGIDMALGFVADRWGRQAAEENARRAEYIWNDDANADPFA